MGSAQNIALPLAFLNTAAADGIKKLCDYVEEVIHASAARPCAVASGLSRALPAALVQNLSHFGPRLIVPAPLQDGMTLRDAVAKMFNDNKLGIFNGNGYSEEYARSGLLQAAA